MMNDKKQLIKRIRKGDATDLRDSILSDADLRGANLGHAMLNKAASRPALGQRVKTTHKLKRLREDITRVWQVVEHAVEGGGYIGYRTYSNGKYDEEPVYEYASDGEKVGVYYAPKYTQKEHFEVWLVVTSEHKNPIAVLPKHCALAIQR